MTARFDYTKPDAMALPVTPVEPTGFDFARYEVFAAEADHRYAQFLAAARGHRRLAARPRRRSLS